MGETESAQARTTHPKRRESSVGALLPLISLVGIDQLFIEYVLWRNRAIHQPQVS